MSVQQPEPSDRPPAPPEPPPGFYPPPTAPEPLPSGPPPLGPPLLGPDTPAPMADAGAVAVATGPSGPPPPATKPHRAILEWAGIIVIAVIAAVVLRTWVVQPYFIPSGSMETTLLVGDKVLVNKLSYDLHPVHRGDVIVFQKPPKDYNPGIKDLIKRVIGLPGDTVSASGGNVYIDGKPLHEPWLRAGVTTVDFRPVHVPAREYFVMGDNRGNSSDSRVIGPISRNLIVGRAFLIVWPLGRIGTL